jgi:hypothetical protein
VDAAMTPDLFIFDVSSDDEVKQAIREFKRRCSLLLDAAFGKKIDVIRSFEGWFDEYVQQTQDPVLVVHEEPLNVVARFLGLNPKQLSSHILYLAEQIATRENWY